MLTVHASYSLRGSSTPTVGPLPSRAHTIVPDNNLSLGGQNPPTKVTSGTHNVPLSAQATGNAPCAFQLKVTSQPALRVRITPLLAAKGQPMKISAAAFLSSDIDWPTKRRQRKNQQFRPMGTQYALHASGPIDGTYAFRTSFWIEAVQLVTSVRFSIESRPLVHQ